MKPIVTHLWFDREAQEAAELCKKAVLAVKGFDIASLEAAYRG